MEKKYTANDVLLVEQEAKLRYAQNMTTFDNQTHKESIQYMICLLKTDIAILKKKTQR